MTGGIILFAHGSRIESANQAVRVVAEELSHSLGVPATAAFLELGQPDLEAAAAMMASRGIQRLVIVPYFLTLGLHMERDLPKLAERIILNNRDIDVRITAPLDGHPGLVRIVRDRALEALIDT